MALKPITFIVATEEVDRHGDRVLLDGIVLDSFKKNPIGYYNHFRSADAWWGDAESTKILPVVRWENIRIEIVDIDGVQTRALVADAVFNEKNQFSLDLYNSVDGGFVNCASIGFMPLAWSVAEEDMAEGQDGYTFTKWELFEISVVDIPANKSATVISKSAEGGIPKTKKLEEEKIENPENHYIYKSLSRVIKKGDNKLVHKKTSNTMKKSLIGKFLDKFKAKGISVKNAEGKDLTEEEIEAMESEMTDLKIEVSEEVVKAAVKTQMEEIDKKIKDLGKEVAKMTAKAAEFENIEKSLEGKIEKALEEKDFVSKESLDAVIKDVAKIKTKKSGGGKGGDGTGELNTDDDLSDDDLLESNPYYKQLLSMKGKGLISEDEFIKQKSALVKVVRK